MSFTAAALLLTACPAEPPGDEESAEDPVTYTVTYDGSGAGSDDPPDDGNAYEEGAEVTVLGNTGGLEKSGYTFTGWNTATDGSGDAYTEGDTFTMSAADVTLYASWEDTFVPTSGKVASFQKISDTVGGFTGTLDDSDRFGNSVCSPGDLDGDGIIDLVVGAYFDGDGGLNHGAVWVLFLESSE